MTNQGVSKPEINIKKPPKGIAILAMVGPGMVWCAEYIGSGEVILATRTGAILGMTVMWAVVVGIFLKYWIGMCGARYTVCTGEGMIDMFDRIPGPRHWVVWIVLFAQLASGAVSIGALASAAGAFINQLVPISSFIWGWLVTVFAVLVVWSGLFNILKIVMSVFVLFIVIGILYVSITVLPGVSAFLQGMLLKIPPVPEWAIESYGATNNAWGEILPLLGWAAGGFASQVWYTYWVLGAGYGAAAGRGYGKPADLSILRNMTRGTANRIKGWCRVVYTDATIAMIIGIVVTIAFLITGAGVLKPNQLAPSGGEMAITLSTIFSSEWGALGGFLFMLSGAAALTSTLIGQLAGWPRLLADSFRICFPGFQKRFAWKKQFRIFLVFFLCSNMIIVYTLGFKPVFLVKMGAILEGLLLTPFQAIWVGIGLFVVMPKLLSNEAREVLRPHWVLAAGLIIAFLVFGYFCLFQLPLLF